MNEPLLYRTGTEDILKTYKDKNVIKVLVGIRRAGKSYLLKLIRDELLQTSVDQSQIVYIDFEDMENAWLYDITILHKFIQAAFEKLSAQKNRRLYLLFDEIQEVPQWEKLVNSLYLSEKIDCDIYITGSNAKLLSSELATYISGRYVTIPIFPLSYTEFLHFTHQSDSPAVFNDFMKFGGFPGLHSMIHTEEAIKSYIDGVYSTVLLKDVITKNKIRDVALLEKIILFICDNIGNIFSAKKIADFMKSNGRSLSVETVYNDLNYLQQALFLYKVRRYDIKGKKLLETSEKYYIGDHGLRFCLLGFKDSAINGILENIVFIELLRRGFEVFIGKIGDTEIDFIAQKNGTKQYIQVCYLLASDETKEREYKPLKQIDDNYPKMILSLDELPDSNEDGIIRKNLRTWLGEKI